MLIPTFTNVDWSEEEDQIKGKELVFCLAYIGDNLNLSSVFVCSPGPRAGRMIHPTQRTFATWRCHYAAIAVPKFRHEDYDRMCSPRWRAVAVATTQSHCA